jgi:hypothetical protein
MTKKMLIDIIANDKTKKGLTNVQNRLGKVKSAVFSLKGALIGLGAGAVIKSFVDVGKEVESLQIRFKFLFGSVDEGSKAFDNLTKFAGKVPFSLEQITRASGNLAVVAKDADDLNRILEITGNVAAVTGLDFETTSSQIQRAFSGGIAAADIFREKGIRSLLGFKEGAKVTAAETVAAFEAAFSGNGRFAQATEDLAQTLEGTLSMIGDKYFNFQKDVAEGFFEELKKEFGDLNKFLGENEKQIEDIANSIGESFASAIIKTSEALKDLAPEFKKVADTSGQLIDGFNSLPTEVKSAGIIAVLLFGKKGFAVAAALSLVVDKIMDIAEVSKDLSIVDPNDLTNVDAIKDRLKLLQDEIDKTKQAIGTPITMELANGVQIDLGEALSIDAQEEYNRLIDERNKLLRILNNLNFTQSEFYTNINSQLETNTEKQGESNEKLLEQYNILGDLSKRHGTEAQLALKALRDKEKAQKEYYDELDRRRQTDKQNSIRAAREKVELEKQAQNEIVSLTGDALSNLSRLNKDAFRAYQLFQIGQAIINAHAAASKALATYPFPANIAIAGLNYAAGAARVAAIRATPAPRISGGRVNAGEPYMVGEAGREMFVPQQSGTIVPNNQLGSPNINITINANDTEGFDDLLIKRRSTIVNVINDALNSQGKEALI